MTEDEYIEICRQKVLEMRKKDKTGMSFVEIMKPEQEYYNAVMSKLLKLINKNMAEKTLGEVRVRTDFNVTGSSIVSDLKNKSAELINLVETLKEKDPRLAALAMTAYEEAAMWAVKLATS